MKVRDVMTSPSRSCSPDTNLVDAAGMMWEYDCGALPVLDSGGRPAGIITDRDVCMAIARRNRFPAEVRVREVMSAPPFVCHADDEVGATLKVMAVQKVRRLPVVDGENRLTGIVSVNDIAAGAQSGRTSAGGAADVHREVIETLLRITAPAAGNASSGH